MSDGVFCEADPPADRSRPLEWRRRFNFVSIPLKNLQLIDWHSVHETEFTFDEEKLEKPANLIKPNIESKAMIRGVLDTEQFRDYIYVAVENKEQGTYSLETVKGVPSVTLTVRKPTEANERSPAGLFWGNAFVSDYKGVEELCFNVSIPAEQMQSLRAALGENENSAMTANVYLLSFTYEVDDFLSEPWHSRDIFVVEPTLCFLAQVSVTSKVGPQVVPVQSVDEGEIDDRQFSNELTIEERQSRELIAAISSFNQPLSHLTKAVWVLVAVVVLAYFIG